MEVVDSIRVEAEDNSRAGVAGSIPLGVVEHIRILAPRLARTVRVGMLEPIVVGHFGQRWHFLQGTWGWRGWLRLAESSDRGFVVRVAAFPRDLAPDNSSEYYEH